MPCENYLPHGFVCICHFLILDEGVVMKQVFLSGCVLGLALSLSACGGGGGGGGGGGSSAGGTTFTVSGMAGNATSRSAPNSLSNANQTASALASNSAVQNLLKTDGALLAGWEADYSLGVESDGSMILMRNSDLKVVTTFKSGDMRFYTHNGVNFATMIEKPRSVTAPNFHGSATEKNAVWIGTLDYAVFGYWAQIMDGKGKFWGFQTSGGSGVHDQDFFYGDYGPSKTAQYNNTMGTLSFTGVAAGMAEYYEEGKNSVVLPLLGTADLTIRSTTNGDLVLTFPDFYKFTWAVNTSGSSISDKQFIGQQKMGSAFPVNLPTTPSISGVNGSLYGNIPTTPSEAAGSWYWYHETPTKGIYVEGVFGVKKK
jgi:hypothetical protein